MRPRSNRGAILELAKESFRDKGALAWDLKKASIQAEGTASTKPWDGNVAGMLEK